ncbi:MAG: hypothetical protein RIR26_1765 [Pseudomonadota bacterium]|jgi:hypothetical protein
MKFVRNSSKSNIEISRREFLGSSALAAAGACIFGFSLPSGNVRAQSTTSRRRPFVIHIHMGAWEGYSAGLMMATSPNVYPKGVFFQNQTVPHPNPNVNVHYPVGSLVFNDYTKVLIPIANHMMFAVATPQSLAHEEAFLIQQTGSRLDGASRSPNWAAGFAQATNGSASGSYVVLDGQGRGVGALARTTPAVTSITAATIDAARTMYSDPPTIPGQATAPESATYASIGKSTYAIDYNLSNMSASEKQGAGAAIDALRRGIPNVTNVQNDINSYMARASGTLSGSTFTPPTTGLDTLFAEVPDKDAVMWVREDGGFFPKNSANLPLRGLPALHEKLKLAAMLIETQVASGIHINMLDGHDFHSGGAHVQTARAACRAWGIIRQFWDWVVSKGYQDDVLVIVGNEFNRTAANSASMTFNGVVTKDAPAGTTVVSPGTDHHLSCGLAFINGRLPPASRLGYIGDTFVPTGGTLNQGPAIGVAPYTSLQLVISVFMRVFPGVFSDYRAVREIWQPIKETDIISELLR